MTLVGWSESADFDDALLQKSYEEALMDFVGRWESWPIYIDTEDQRWLDGGVNRRLYQHHLVLSTQMVVSAIRHGSILAAKWGVDALNRWFSNVTDHSEGNYKYYWNTEILVPSVIDYDKEAAEWTLIKNGHEEDVDLKSAAAIAMMNSWVDARVVTACYLLNRPDDTYGKDVKELVEYLISSKGNYSPPTSPERAI